MFRSLRRFCRMDLAAFVILSLVGLPTAIVQPVESNPAVVCIPVIHNSDNFVPPSCGAGGASCDQDIVVPEDDQCAQLGDDCEVAQNSNNFIVARAVVHQGDGADNVYTDGQCDYETFVDCSAFISDGEEGCTDQEEDPPGGKFECPVSKYDYGTAGNLIGEGWCEDPLNPTRLFLTPISNYRCEGDPPTSRPSARSPPSGCSLTSMVLVSRGAEP